VEVDFLIDGKVRCVEHASPWNYGSDDFHGHLGWLVTSWLKPGTHRFTARARLADGTRASDTVSARVSAAPRPPAALATGRWVRTVTESEIRKYGGELPAGKWQLVFDRVGVWELDPGGWREDGPPATYRWSVAGDRLTLTPKSEISGS
jgi:hypothetical protein